MIANTAGFLLIIGLLALFKYSPRYDRSISFLLTGAVFCAFYGFAKGLKQNVFGHFSMLWDSSPAGDITLEIISSRNVYFMICPFLVITALSLFNNLFFRYEVRRKNYTALLVFNLLCLIMLAAGNNFIQMITFVFVIDILSQFFIKNTETGRRYAIYNLIADMGLFGILAILNGQVENLDINHIRNFYQAEKYRDLVAILLMSSLFIKFGFVIFKNYVLELKQMRFHWLILIPYLSSPAAALILLVKLHSLLVVSPLFLPIFNVVLALIMIYGTLGVINIPSLKEKTIFLNIMLVALLVKLIQSADFVWDIHFSWLIILSFCFNFIVYYLHYYAERSNNADFSARFKRVGRSSLCIILLLWLVVMSAFVVQSAAFIRPDNLIWQCWFMVFWGLVSATVFNKILHHHKASELDAESDYAPYPLLLVVLAISVYSLQVQMQNWAFALFVCGVFLLGLKTNSLAAISKMSIADRFESLITKKIQFYFWNRCWLFIDYMVVQNKAFKRNVASFFARSVNGAIAMFRRVGRVGIVRYIIFISIGVCVFVLCFGGINS